MKKVVLFLVMSLMVVAGLFMTGCMSNEKGLDPDNRAPMINYFDVYPQTVVRNNTVTITVNYTDYDGDDVEFTIVEDPERENPADCSEPDTTSNPTVFTWFAPRFAGRYWFSATGTDGNFTTESIFSIIVLSRPPNVEWNGAAPADPLFHKVEAAATQKNFDFDVQDDDSFPTSTITVDITVEKSDTSDTWADTYVVELYDNQDTDAITVNSATSATITLDTPSKTVMLSTRAYYPAGADKTALLASPGTWGNTMTVTFDFTDESGYSDSIVQKILIFN